MQKFLGKLNYLRQFISNMSGKISAFSPILRLKNEAEFTWETDQQHAFEDIQRYLSSPWLKNEAEFTWETHQQHAFEDIQRYLSSPSVMKAPMAGIPFRLSISAEDALIGAVLTPVMEGKKHIITYLSRRLIDVETRYSFIEKLCSSLFYACSNYDIICYLALV
jgi:hypothetical protein